MTYIKQADICKWSCVLTFISNHLIIHSIFFCFNYYKRKGFFPHKKLSNDAYGYRLEYYYATTMNSKLKLLVIVLNLPHTKYKIHKYISQINVKISQINVNTQINEFIINFRTRALQKCIFSDRRGVLRSSSRLISDYSNFTR